MNINDSIGGYELSENQKNLWYVSKNNPEVFYNQIILEVKIDLSIEDFLNAFTIVKNSNNILVFKLIHNLNFHNPFQIESADTATDWNEIELMNPDLMAHEINDALRFTYDPAKSSPIRFCFVKQSGRVKHIAVRVYSLWGDINSCHNLCRQIFTAILSKQSQSTDEEKIDYINFSAWQNDLIAQPEREAKVFWKNYNYQLTESLVPFFKSQKGFMPKKKQISFIDGENYSTIKKFCSDNDCEIKSVFLFHFINYLHLFSENEVTIGVSNFKREYKELDETLGLVSKNLPLKIKKLDKFGIIDALYYIESQLNIVEEWSDFFTLGREKSDNSSKDFYFNYCFEFIDLKLENERFSNEFKVQDMFSVQDTFDIKISCIDSGDSVSVAFYYNENCLNQKDIDVLSDQFDIMYDELLVMDKQNKLGETQKHIIKSANATAKNFPAYHSIVALIEEQSCFFPANTALFTNEKELTYLELNNKSDQFKNYLIEKHNIKKGDAVCVVGEGTEWFIIAIMGIMKAGAYYIPVDLKYPKDRIDHIITESNCSVLVTEENALNSQHVVQVISPFDKEIYSVQRKNHKIDIDPQDFAYCIYTSGSTGKPKGCAISHASLLNYIQWSNEFYFENPDVGNWGLITSISFDLTITSIFTSLSRGKKLWLGNFDKSIIELLRETFNNPKIDTVKLTPAHVSLLKELDIKNSSVKKIICGGEQLLKYQIEILKNINKDICIYNEYGPTESTVGCIVKEIKEDDETILIGKPIANTSIYILDKNQSYCPVGVKGEIYIAGSGLASGYLNRPDLTAEKFINNPFVNGELLYKSGDLACWLPDGNIEYFGRLDDQVKIRGHRIELGEIEQLISNYGAISQSVVTVKENDNEKYLVAYYVSGDEIDKKALKNSLSKILPDYMVPGYYIQLPVMPLTSNGKIDKKILAEVVEKDLIKEEYISPRTKEEELLVSVCLDVLKHDRISVKDNFYNYGGDSIKSIQIVSRLKQLGYSLKVDQILRNPILEDLAKLIKSNTVVVDQSEVKGDVVLNPIQNDFFQSSTIINKNHYNQSVLLKSKVAVNQEILEQCISKLILHHDALRMQYSFINDQWLQYNNDASGKHYKINFYDLTEDPNELESLNRIGEELQSGFDIGSGVLVHVGHFRLKDGDRLALIIHHLVIDGISWRIFLEDLSTLYESISSNNEKKLPLKTDSFQRWTASQLDYAKSENVEKERAYWENVSSEIIPLLPTDYNQEPKKSKLDELINLVLDASLTEKLQTQVHHIYNTEINDILLTSLAMAIRDVFEIEKTAVRMEGHGREEIIEGIDIGRTIGWFTSVYPVILDLAGSEGYEIVSIKESLRKIPGKGIGYGILNYLDKPFSNKLKPSIEFNYLGDFGHQTKENKEPLFKFSSENIGASVASVNGKGEILLDVSGIMISGELHMSIRYSGSLFNRETIEKLTDAYRQNLENLIEELSGKKQNYLTPSDLTYKKIQYSDLAGLNHYSLVEDIYELSPLQQGMYYHWLLDKKDLLYYNQVSYRLYFADFNSENVKKAFEQLIARHAVLRTSFTNKLGEEMLQIVHKKVTANFKFDKLIADENSIEQKLNQIKQTNKTVLFDFEEPSLIRLTVIEVKEGEYEFIWNYHHILLDGWCTSILINDFSNLLSSLQHNTKVTLQKPVGYSKYIEWLSKLDKGASLKYWRNYLEGFNEATQLPFNKNEEGYALITKEFFIENDLWQKINSICNETDITNSTFFQGVWGYMLSRINDTNDVIFGAIVSGRPAELNGVETIVGLFSNTIPVRVSYGSKETPRELLKRLQNENIDSTPHHFLNISEVQRQSTLNKSLINTIMIFENYVIHDLNLDESLDMGQIGQIDVNLQTNFDFNFEVVPSESNFKIKFDYNQNRFDQQIIQDLVDYLKFTLELFAVEFNTAFDLLSLRFENKKKISIGYNAKALNNTVNAFARNEENTVVAGLTKEKIIGNNIDKLSKFLK